VNRNVAVKFHKVGKVYERPWFGRRLTALHEVTFSIDAGEVFGLIGPNRAGKTTLAKCLLSICRPTSGEITRLGRPWAVRSTLTEVGYVHENPAFPRYLNARQLVEGYGRLSGIKGTKLRDRAGQLLEQVGLADRTHESIASFSKGMLQRLALAQALVNDPRLLVLDEPSEGMDLSARQLLDRVILERRRQGHTVILISHALDDIERLCDRVAVLKGGRAVFVGAVAELAASAATQNETPALQSALEPLYEEALA